MKKLLSVLLISGAAVAFASEASASPVVIQDGSIRAGVNDFGTLGSGNSTTPGILFDPTATGNYGVNDFLTPGDPFEAFAVKATGYYATNNNNSNTYGENFVGAAPTSLTSTSASWTGSDATLSVSNLYNLTTLGGRSVIAITTTLTNLSGATLADLQFERILDPDPDVNAFGSFSTNNSLVSANQACATGPLSGQTICISTANTAFTNKAGITSGWSRDPSVILAGINDGPTGDFSIALAFALGSLGVGQSVTFDYYYSAGATKDIATGGTSVPEPLTLSLFGAGLAGAVGMRRRKKAQKG